MKKYTRYFKKCEEFSICEEVGDANVIGIEPAEERTTLYHIVVKGSGRVAKIFDSEYMVGDVNGVYFADVKQFLGHHTIFESFEPPVCSFVDKSLIFSYSFIQSSLNFSDSLT